MDWHDHGGKRLADTAAYRSIERILWVAAPIIVLFLLLNIPSMQAAHRQADEDFSKAAATENAEYCRKWGMRAGSDAYAACIRDVVGIRDRAEHHCRAEANAGF